MSFTPAHQEVYQLQRVKDTSKLILDEYDVTVLENGEKEYSKETGSSNVQFLKSLNQDRTCDVTLENEPLGCACDRLLQEFHRYDESISWQGKWGGGSVTAVCRGWGTSNVSRKCGIMCYFYFVQHEQ